jgi:hypothetical protein
MAAQEPDKLADALEREADSLERHARELGDHTEEARKEWERKRADLGVPGAPPADSDGPQPEAEFPGKAESLEDED